MTALLEGIGAGIGLFLAWLLFMATLIWLAVRWLQK